MNLDRLLGADVNAALGMAAAYGAKVRVVSTDGVPAVVTKDFDPNRLNLTVADGKVVRVTTG